MRVCIKKSTARGNISAPTSKSLAHRLLIAAALCEGESVISGISPCEDVLATLDCLRALGAEIEYSGGRARVRGVDMTKATAKETLCCRESGSTLRFILPLALLSGEKARLTGSRRLIERPHTVYEEICREKGLLYLNDGEAITVCGPLSGGEYSLPGNISSQFITGLIYALAATGKESRIRITTEIESLSYIELTRSALSSFGVEAIWENASTLYIKGGQKFTPAITEVEGDYSGAVFLEAFNYFGGEVMINGLSEESLQGDRAYKSFLPLLDKGFAEISIENCPDLGPILFAFAAAKHGAKILGTRRLRIKESDRSAAMQAELKKFGAELLIEENSVTVFKRSLHTPKKVLSGHNDHRIVMSLALLCSLYGGEIEGCEAVNKSYTDYFKDIKALGIETEIYDT